MVQINKLSPFQLKNFDTMIKTYGVFFLVGLLLHFVTENSTQKERSLFFVLLFLILLIVGIIGKRCFTSKKYERLGLWLLYLSMIVATIGFPLLAYATESSQSIEVFMYNCAMIFFASVGVNIYFIVMRKYGRKFLSERFFIHVAFLPIIILFFIPVIQLAIDDNLISALVWCGVICLSLTMAQYPRINTYFEQKNTNRYGNSLEIMNQKKETRKK